MRPVGSPRSLVGLRYVRFLRYMSVKREPEKYLPDEAESGELLPFKDHYIREFLGLGDEHSERELRKSNLANLRDFFLEFGRDLTFVGEEYAITVGNDTFYLDLLFFHRRRPQDRRRHLPNRPAAWETDSATPRTPACSSGGDTWTKPLKTSPGIADYSITRRVTDGERKVLGLAACWHDRGKAHASFGAKLKANVLNELPDEVRSKLDEQPIAKAPNVAWRHDPVSRSNTRLAAAGSETDVESPERMSDARRPKFRHELASALAILETLRRADANHGAIAWPEGLDRAEFDAADQRTDETLDSEESDLGSLWLAELKKLKPHEIDLLVYLVAAHHGKVRMSPRSVPQDARADQPDPCPLDKRRARGVQDGDQLAACRLPGADGQAPWLAPEVILHLDPMELGLFPRYGASWRERTQGLLERLGPFRLAYLEALLRVADCRASAEEDAAAKDAAVREIST